jgi:hypothetical protein|tara:strand:- start:1423 stop:1680 length:258 start_codon:yes stop_codon:yes gene_type:complete
MASELFEKRLALTRHLLALGFDRTWLSTLKMSELETLVENQEINDNDTTAERAEEILREENIKAQLEIIEQKRGNKREEPFLKLD